MSATLNNLCIGWHGLPSYAARLIKAAGGDFPVVASRPAVPIEGMDDILPGRIRWIDDRYADGWSGLNLKVPRLYFQPSWATPAFNSLGSEVLAGGGHIVVMFDNPWRGDFRQMLGALRFRTQWRKRFAAAWVAGSSGRRLAKFWGFSPNNIYEGMYGADPGVFSGSERVPIQSRPKRFIFVGRLVREKGVLELIDAWRKFFPGHNDWEMHVYGVGPLCDRVQAEKTIHFHGFQQPSEISRAMKESRFLILPSHLEHWGLVVCEAAQAGCGLLLSSSVGSSLDFMNSDSPLLYAPKDACALLQAMRNAAHMSEGELTRLQGTLINNAVGFTPKRWAANFATIVEKYL